MGGLTTMIDWSGAQVSLLEINGMIYILIVMGLTWVNLFVKVCQNIETLL